MYIIKKGCITKVETKNMSYQQIKKLEKSKPKLSLKEMLSVSILK